MRSSCKRAGNGTRLFSTCWNAPGERSVTRARSNELELSSAAGASDDARHVNIDIGYMDLDKVVLPSYKRGPFKLYAGEGVWLDMLLTYAKGLFHPTQWAFEDFKRNPYQHDLQLIRERWRKSLREESHEKAK